MTFICIAVSPDFDRDQIIATIDLSEGSIPAGALQIHLHTGGTGRESEVVIPRIEIRAEKITRE